MSINQVVSGGPVVIDTKQTQFIGPDVEVASAIGTVGFYGADPVARLSVTGSVTAGTALPNLLAALNTLGIVSNNTTA